MPNRNARLGMILFFVYLAFYGGFVLIAACWPEAMARTPLAGVNLAIWYGFALIAAALILAGIYGVLCRTNAADELAAPSASTQRHAE